MSKEIKMSDYFVLPMICEDGHSFIFSNDLSHSMMFDYFNPRMMENKKAVAHAINNHDRLVEENNRLREFLESLQLDVSNEIKLEQLLSELDGE